jgi:hypothetical protein
MTYGEFCDLTGIDATLLEIYVKIDCEGCCEQTFRVNLDDCCDNTQSSPTPTPSITPTSTPSSSIGTSPSVTPTVTLSITPTSSVTPSVTPSVTLSVTPSVTNSVTPSITPSVTLSVTPSVTNSVTPTPSSTPPIIYDYYIADECCGFDSITIALVQGTSFNQDAGVEYNGNKYVITGSGTAPAVVFSATTIDNICDTAICPSVTPTMTPTMTPTPTPSSTPPICECNTYLIEFAENCSEAITWTNCDTGLSMSEQGLYFGLDGSTFTSGTSITLCSCSLPIVGCPNVAITLISAGCTAYYYYIVMEVDDCNTGSVFGETYVVRSVTSITINSYINSTIAPGPLLCAWKIISSTTGPFYDGTVTNDCGTSLPVSCCC